MSDGVMVFQGQLRTLAQKLDINLGTVMRTVAFEIFGDIVKATPVDTGRARAGWAITINAPNVEQPPPSTMEPTPEGGTGTASDPQFSVPPFGDVSKITGQEIVFITNPVVYIERLEHGHSKQAPLGMVQLAMLRAAGGIEYQLAQME